MTITNGSEVNELMFAYDSEGTAFAMSYNETVYYYLTDIQGNVNGLIDENGNIVAEYAYDVWGKPISATATTETHAKAMTANPIRYRGYTYDSDTGLYYLQSRYYDPTTGRFLNADDVSYLGTTGNVLSYNLFAYCENDAINNSDPTGCSLTLTATGLAVSILAMISIRFLAKYIVKALFCAIEGIVKFIYYTTVWHLNYVIKPTIEFVKFAAEVAATYFKYAFNKAKKRAEVLISLLSNYSTLLNEISKAAEKSRTKKFRRLWEDHHIVAENDYRAAAAKLHMEDHGIGVNSRVNRVYISYNLHRHLHTTLYHNCVSELIISCRTESEILGMLAIIKQLLKSVDRACQR